MVKLVQDIHYYLSLMPLAFRTSGSLLCQISFLPLPSEQYAWHSPYESFLEIPHWQLANWLVPWEPLSLYFGSKKKQYLYHLSLKFKRIGDELNLEAPSTCVPPVETNSYIGYRISPLVECPSLYGISSSSPQHSQAEGTLLPSDSFLTQN